MDLNSISLRMFEFNLNTIFKHLYKLNSFSKMFSSKGVITNFEKKLFQNFIYLNISFGDELIFFRNELIFFPNVAFQISYRSHNRFQCYIEGKCPFRIEILSKSQRC